MSLAQRVRTVPAKANSMLRPKDLREGIASALGASPASIRIERIEIRKDVTPIVHVWGAWRNAFFFAKVFPAAEYPAAPRMETPWELSSHLNVPARSADSQVAAEWKRANELRALGGAVHIPVPLGKSDAARTIVWERVDGVRVDHLVARWGARKDRERSATDALLQAGAWLRKIHDSSVQAEQSVDVAQVFETLREWTMRTRCSWDKDHRRALGLLSAAQETIGGSGKILSPVTLTHGDFALPNMMWDDKRDGLVVLDFEHSDYRSSWHDLATLLFSLRGRLLNPFMPKRLISGLEEAFWTGYGPVSREARCIVEAVALSRIFYYYLPRIETRWQRRGWLRGAVANFYLASVKNRVLERRLGIPPSL
jgi:aminoglycoside phosphotransferase (APT) family kinase protein